MKNSINFALEQRKLRVESISRLTNSTNSSEVMKKAFIPSNLESEFQNEFTVLASRFYNLQTILEHCHRETKSGPRHDALGEAYYQVSYIKDEVLEFIIGDSGKDYGSLRTEDLPIFTPDMAVEAANLICSFSMEVQNFAKKYVIPCVENKAQDLHGVGAKLKYKLQLNNSDEGRTTNSVTLTKSNFKETIVKNIETPSEQVSNTMYGTILHNFEKGLISEEIFLGGLNVVDKLEKGKKVPVGTIREWSDGKYQKTENGWVAVKKDKKASTSKEEESDEEVAKRSGISVEEYRKLHPSTKEELRKVDNKSSEKKDSSEKMPVLEALDSLSKYGVTYTLNNSKVNPVERVNIPTNLSDREYDKIEDVIDRYNLGNKKRSVEKKEDSSKYDGRFKNSPLDEVLLAARTQINTPNAYQATQELLKRASDKSGKKITSETVAIALLTSKSKEKKIEISPRDSGPEVARKLNLDKATAESVRKISEEAISDKEVYQKISKLIGAEKADLYMKWMEAEDYK